MDTIDFEATARRIVELTDPAVIREQLRLVWNARGAADIATIDAMMPRLLDAAQSGPVSRNLDRALRALDR